MCIYYYIVALVKILANGGDGSTISRTGFMVDPMPLMTAPLAEPDDNSWTSAIAVSLAEQVIIDDRTISWTTVIDSSITSWTSAVI